MLKSENTGVDHTSFLISYLEFLAENPKSLERFFGESGLSLETIRQEFAKPSFLGFVIDFLLSDESQLLAFCANGTWQPQQILSLRRRLPGSVSGESEW